MHEAIEQALSSFQHEQALSIVHARRAEEFLSQFLSLMNRKDGGSGIPTGQSIRCVREWTRWLSNNGPALRSTITEGTGVKFSDRGTAHTFIWDDSMLHYSDDSLPQFSIVRMRSVTTPGRGAPPVIYFLWSQRWQVLPKFGVGPIKPRSTQSDHRTCKFISSEIDSTKGALSEGYDSKVDESGYSVDNEILSLLGVVQPPMDTDKEIYSYVPDHD